MNTTRDNYNRMRLDDILEHSSISVDTRNCVMELLDQVEDTNLRQVLRIEVKRMLGDHDRLVSSLRQHIEMLDNENTEHKAICNEYQRRYEKAVREMQFFKRKYDVTKEQLQKPSDSLKPGYIQALSQSKSQPTRANLPIDQSEYPPFDPMGDFGRQGLQANTFVANSPTWPGSPMSVVSDSTSLSTPRYRQNSTAANSLFSLQSSSTDSQSVYSAKQPADVLHEKSSWASRQIDLPFRSNGSVSSGNSVHSAPNAPRSLAAAVSDYSTLTRVQQRQLEPLSFGGSDGLWDTISKSKESDMTIEKMISNFLRRGGSPNTAKQSSTAQLVKYGYGLIHALIATKSPSSLDLLLQHGANPNCMTLSQTADDRVN
ncbi:hypothetical protein J3Q64DRAFT_1046249 [Phycomyces blakesleeanus]|uniref:Uncharacterized protein n=1 Tax=Phycomyces blakesleeanus TaxID=4837 RepID=A0ABR3BDY7_PHYBL